jgi:hypothetical protein
MTKKPNSPASANREAANNQNSEPISIIEHSEADAQARKARDEHLFVQIPCPLLRDPSVLPAAKILYGRLKLYAGEDGAVFASHKTLAAAIGVSPKHVRHLLTQLRDRWRLIYWQQTKGGSSRYFFTEQQWDKLQKPQSKDPGDSTSRCEGEAKEGSTSRCEGVAPTGAGGSHLEVRQKEVIKEVSKKTPIPARIVERPAAAVAQAQPVTRGANALQPESTVIPFPKPATAPAQVNPFPWWEQIVTAYPHAGLSSQNVARGAFLNHIDHHKGREQEWVDEILAGIEKWKRSDRWNRGYINELKNFLADEIYRQEPPPPAGKKTAAVFRSREPITEQQQQEPRCAKCWDTGEITNPVLLKQQPGETPDAFVARVRQMIEDGTPSHIPCPKCGGEA